MNKEIEDVVEEFMADFPCFDSSCDLHGNIPHQVSDDEWEAQQCQYCFEVRLPLKERLRTTLTSLLEKERDKSTGLIVCETPSNVSTTLGTINHPAQYYKGFNDGLIKALEIINRKE